MVSAGVCCGRRRLILSNVRGRKGRPRGTGPTPPVGVTAGDVGKAGDGEDEDEEAEEAGDAPALAAVVVPVGVKAGAEVESMAVTLPRGADSMLLRLHAKFVVLLVAVVGCCDALGS